MSDSFKWKTVSAFSGAEDDAIIRLDKVVGLSGAEVTRLRADTGERAILAELGAILKACRRAQMSFSVEGLDLEESADILALSGAVGKSSLDELRSVPRAGAESCAGILTMEGESGFKFQPLAGSLPPVGRKIPEGPDNLRKRAEWFRRRSGDRG